MVVKIDGVYAVIFVLRYYTLILIGYFLYLQNVSKYFYLYKSDINKNMKLKKCVLFREIHVLQSFL